MFMLFIVLMIRINLKVKTFLCEKSCVNYKELLLAGAGVSKVKYLMVKNSKNYSGENFSNYVLGS